MREYAGTGFATVHLLLHVVRANLPRPRRRRRVQMPTARTSNTSPGADDRGSVTFHTLTNRLFMGCLRDDWVSTQELNLDNHRRCPLTMTKLKSNVEFREPS